MMLMMLSCMYCRGIRSENAYMRHSKRRLKMLSFNLEDLLDYQQYLETSLTMD